MSALEPVFRPYREEACDIERSRPDVEELCADERESEGESYRLRTRDPNRPPDRFATVLPTVPGGLFAYGAVDRIGVIS